MHDDINRLMNILSPYYYEEAKCRDLFITPPHILKALLMSSFAPNLMIGTTRVRDQESSKKRKGGVDNFNSKEVLFQEMLMKGLDPRKAIQMVLDLPRDIDSRETMKEDLQETLAQMMSCDPRELIIHLDPDWKRLYIEFKDKDQYSYDDRTSYYVDDHKT